MCGIVGGFDRAGLPFGDAMARAACQRIVHRGPDDEGWLEADGMLIGNRRLSILDLTGGHQPMVSDDGQIGIVQNGEIYNFVELSRGLPCRTQCDTEVILRLYEREGDQFVTQLNGMFAIAIVDRRRRRLILYRDRLGKKPLYICDDGNRLLFASEIKSLLAMGFEPQIDWQALDAYLTYGYVPPPLTMFRGIRHVMPGNMLAVDRQTIREETWWDLNVVPEDRPVHAWHEEMLAVLQDAVRIRLRSDVPLGAFLSGGIDSSLVVKLMSDHVACRPRTFCIGLPDSEFRDADYSSRAAKFCGTHHSCTAVDARLTDLWPLVTYHNDQPHGDISFLPTYWVSRAAREHLKVVLTGDGADELFAGYDCYRNVTAGAGANQEHVLARQDTYLRGISVFDPVIKEALLSPDVRRQTQHADAYSFARGWLNRFSDYDPLNQALALDVKQLLPGNNLVKPDKMAMAVSLEARVPFLDYRLVELAFRIPGRLKLVGSTSKSILKSLAATLLPKEIVHRPKQTFSLPIGSWFRDSLRPFLQQVLLSSRPQARGIFDLDSVSALIDRHTAGVCDYTRQLRALVAFELWWRIFLEDRCESAPTYEDIGITFSPDTKSPPRFAA